MPESPSADVLDRLLALQAADHHVRKVEHRLDALPEQRQLDEAVERVTVLERQLDELSAKLERSSTEQRTLERDIETLGNRRDSERVRLYDGTVTNQREMSSVEAEIESTERRLEEHEEDLLVVMQTVEDLETRWAAVDGELVAARARVRGAEEARDEVAKALLAELGQAKADRDREAAELPTELRERYEDAAKRGGGTGVGELDGLTCSACRIEMSRADVDELYRGGDLTTCPQCRRLLVVR